MTHARGSILLADDEEKILKRLGRALRDEGHEVVEATTMRDAQRYLGERTFDLLVVDNVMPGMTGLELIRELAQTPPVERPQIVMMTAHGSTQLVREAFKLGVEDFLEKPFEVDELLALARRAVKSQRLRTERQYLISERDADFNHYGIVGRSRSMEKVLERAELVSQTKSTVLITGETGTGKEMVARLIHHRSAQREMPLIKVNCAAIPDTLLESELFGHVRGAFTGASVTKRGRVRAGRRRLDLPRRNRYAHDGDPVETAARPAGARVRAARRRADAARGRARDCRDQPRSEADGGDRPVSGGSVLPPQRDPDRAAAAARAA